MIVKNFLGKKDIGTENFLFFCTYIKYKGGKM